MALKKFFNVSALTTSAGLSPSWAYTCANAVAPKRLLPSPKSTNNKRDCPLSVRNCGVTVLRTSSTRAKALMIKESGEVTLFCSPFSCQVVFMDMESLPTGMVKPNCGQSSSPTAFTAAYKPASSPLWPAADIQLADNLMRLMSPMFVAAMLVMDSATAKRADAAKSSNATGVRSPMDMASP